MVRSLTQKPTLGQAPGPAAVGVTFEELRQMALALPGVEDGTSYGTPALKVKGKLFIRLREDGESVVLPTDLDEREILLQVAHQPLPSLRQALDSQVQEVCSHFQPLGSKVLQENLVNKPLGPSVQALCLKKKGLCSMGLALRLKEKAFGA